MRVQVPPRYTKFSDELKVRSEEFSISNFSLITPNSRTEVPPERLFLTLHVVGSSAW